RGLKIFGVFALLNVAHVIASPGSLGKMRAVHSSLKSLLAIYIVGSNLGGGADKTITFSILLPISYLLIISALLLFACRIYRHAFIVAGVLFLVAALVADNMGAQGVNLPLLSIGLLGVILGYVPIEKIDAVAKHPYWLAIGYAAYLAAITIWNVIFPLQL